jgi:hypothetical protein
LAPRSGLTPTHVAGGDNAQVRITAGTVKASYARLAD